MENGVSKRKVKTERVRVPYRFSLPKTSLSRDSSSAESAGRPEKQANHLVQIRVFGAPHNSDNFLSSLLFKGGGFLSSNRPVLDPFEQTRKI
jgi:hypothetical protein